MQMTKLIKNNDEYVCLNVGILKMGSFSYLIHFVNGTERIIGQGKLNVEKRSKKIN